jgi:hypothetical protein
VQAFGVLTVRFSAMSDQKSVSVQKRKAFSDSLSQDEQKVDFQLTIIY